MTDKKESKQQRFYRLRRTNGLCVLCGVKANKYLCAECMTRQIEYNKRSIKKMRKIVRDKK